MALALRSSSKLLMRIECLKFLLFDKVEKAFFNVLNIILKLFHAIISS
jgi:hypothetical protein